jgi:hypothetical protein
MQPIRFPNNLLERENAFTSPNQPLAATVQDPMLVETVSSDRAKTETMHVIKEQESRIEQVKNATLAKKTQ